MQLRLFLAVAIATLISGCGSLSKVNVPSNEVSFKTPHGELSLKHPQNCAMTNVFVRFETNGTIEARIGAIISANNPDVIDRSAAGEVAKINAMGTQVREAFKAGAETLGTAAGTTLKTAK